VTAFNGASSQLTLKIMLGVALVMVPIVLAYQFWTYRSSPRR
jgi:cytochrome d ubiquinol oxidase subunit II